MSIKPELAMVRLLSLPVAGIVGDFGYPDLDSGCAFEIPILDGKRYCHCPRDVFAKRL